MATKENILSSEAIKFVLTLSKLFDGERMKLLEKRNLRQKEIDNNVLPTFLQETENVRNSNWKISKIPDDLIKRTVEITGPPERKMMINALNSGSDCYMCDFEDSLAPTRENLINGQINLYDYIRSNIKYFDTKKNKLYEINDYTKTPTLFIRPR